MRTQRRHCIVITGSAANVNTRKIVEHVDVPPRQTYSTSLVKYAATAEKCHVRNTWSEWAFCIAVCCSHTPTRVHVAQRLGEQSTGRLGCAAGECDEFIHLGTFCHRLGFWGFYASGSPLAPLACPGVGRASCAPLHVLVPASAYLGVPVVHRGRHHSNHMLVRRSASTSKAASHELNPQQQGASKASRRTCDVSELAY